MAVQEKDYGFGDDGQRDLGRAELGILGEDIAASYFVGLGFRVLERRYRVREGELDLVCIRGAVSDSAQSGLKSGSNMIEELIFVEVKTRASSAFGRPEAAVSGRKKRRLRRCAKTFADERGFAESALRVDVVSITVKEDGTYVLDHIEDAVGIYESLNEDHHNEWRLGY